ncbi:MAG: glutamate racemase [Thermotogaceae bacterium]|nr:glutamate racemase [Thermotogaceae bacterium]
MKIGLFDSGVGGISVLRKLVDFFPQFDYVYIADTANSPYGTKNDNLLFQLVKNILNFLDSKQVDIIVAACNTADSVVKQCLKENSDTLYVSIIDNVKRIVKSDRIGIVATENTIKSKVYEKTLGSSVVYRKSLQSLVTAIERNFANKELIKNIIKETLKGINEFNVKELILGCTHFPLVYDIFEKLLPGIKIVDPANGIIEYMKEKFGERRNGKNNLPKVEFYITGNPITFEENMKNFINLSSIKSSIRKVGFGGVESETGIHNLRAFRCR